MTQSGIAIVGGGLAALRSAEALRKAGYQGPVTVYSAEAHYPYNRPPLSKKALADGPDATSLHFPRRAEIADVTWKLDTRIEAADLAAHTLRDATGATYGFDGLIAATGVRSRQLPIPGPHHGRYLLRSIEDATALHQRLTAGTRVVIVGAGFIGCELAATLRATGCQVTVVAADAEAMIRPLGAEVGAAIRHRHETHGVEFHLGVGLSRYLGETTITGVELDNGTTIPADVVIEAVGSQCNVEWLAGNNLDLTDGILVNGQLLADHPTPLVAIGDVARFPNQAYDPIARRIEHWQVAIDTAKHGARSLLAALGHHDPQPDLHLTPYFWSDQHDLKIQSFGAPNLATHTQLLEGDLTTEAAIGYYHHDHLVATVLLGLQPQALKYRQLLTNQTTQYAI